MDAPHLFPEEPPNIGSSPDRVAAEMERTGFRLLIDQRGKSLTAELQRLAQRLSKEERDAGMIGRGVYFNPEPEGESAIQWWIHPAGMLCQVKRSPARPDHQVRIYACADCGYGDDPQPGAKRLFGPDGQSLRLTNGAPLTCDRWTGLRALASRRLLLPVHQWPDFHLDMVSFHLLGLPDPPPTLDKIDTEAKIDSLISRHVFSSLEEVLGPWEDALEGVDSKTGGWIRGRVENHTSLMVSPSLPGPLDTNSRIIIQSRFCIHDLKKEKKTFKSNAFHEKASRAIHEALSGRGAKKEWIGEAGRRVSGAWLKALKDRRHPSLFMGEYFPNNALEKENGGPEFHHVLMSLPNERGVMRKMRWWIEHEDLDKLQHLASAPAPDGITLPMRLVRAWIQVDNERVNPWSQRLRRLGSRFCLEALAQRVPVHEWMMQTSKASPWDGFLDSTIFFPDDTDLIQAHKEAFEGLLEWMESTGVTIPDHLNVPGHGRVALGSPLLPQVLEQAVREERVPDRGPVAARIDGYFDFLPSHLLKEKMDREIPRPSLARPGVSRF